MVRPKKLRRDAVGAYGSKVELYERQVDGPIYQRWWDGKRQVSKSLGHRDWDKANETARELSAQLLQASEEQNKDVVTWLEASSCYEQEVSRHKKGQGMREDQRRIAIWTQSLGTFADVSKIVPAMLDKFTRERKAGRFKVPGRKLKPKVSNRAVDADIVFLQSVLNWSVKNLRKRDGSPRLLVNPIAGYKRPKNATVKRPVMSYDYFEKVREHADEVDGQRLFGPFLDLVEAIGWRVSAVCQIKASHIDKTAYPDAPNGKLWKNPEVDKEGVDDWIPLSPDARKALDRALAISAVLGDRYIFRAPKAKRGVDKPWSRWHARDLLERAVDKAELPKLEGGDWHPLRRKWATERKDFALADVMRVGGWRDHRSLQNSYQQSDPHTMLAVVESTTKLREVKTQ